METLSEEILKQEIFNILHHFVDEKDMSFGTAYYVLKDTFNEFSMAYNNYLKQELKKKEENSNNISSEVNSSINKDEIKEEIVE